LWACQAWNLTPRQVARRFSTAALIVLADGQFWANYVPERDEPSERGNVTRRDGRNLSGDAFMALFGGGTT
jgi:hypothetical protein